MLTSFWESLQIADQRTFFFVFFVSLSCASHAHDEKGTIFIIFQCFSSFSTMQMHAQACIHWSKYTTKAACWAMEQPCVRDRWIPPASHDTVCVNRATAPLLTGELACMEVTESMFYLNRTTTLPKSVLRCFVVKLLFGIIFFSELKLKSCLNQTSDLNDQRTWC